jgi:hypothetical protein
LTGRELAILADPPADIAADVAALQPGALVFTDDAEREILRRGRPLDARESGMALAVGVAHPEQVRVLVHDGFIEPTDEAFIALCRELGVDLDAPEAGRTSGHGIEVLPWFARSRTVMAHELAHVAQYERLGTAGLLRDYLTQLLTVGYERAPLEVEARSKEHKW